MFSELTSEYMRFYLAPPSSSSLIHLKSEASIPPYLGLHRPTGYKNKAWSFTKDLTKIEYSLSHMKYIKYKPEHMESVSVIINSPEKHNRHF